MSKLPVLTADEIIRILKKLGFFFERQRGSHMIFKNDNKLSIVVPMHKGEDVDRGLLRKIISDTGLSVEEFLSYR